jgi:hypothetical protein
MFNSFKEKATSLAEAASQKTEAALSSGSQKGQELFADYYPKMEPMIVDGLLGMAEEKLNDELALSGYFEKAYELLPMPVRLVVSRAQFIEFTMKHKAPLLQKVSEVKHKRLALASSAQENAPG